MKEPTQLELAVHENPFGEIYDSTRIHLVFTNDTMHNQLLDVELDGEELNGETRASICICQRMRFKKQLNTNYLEKKLEITATMRN